MNTIMPELADLSPSHRRLFAGNPRVDANSISPGWRTIPRQAQRSPGPLSLAQHQIWLNSQNRDRPPFYNESITIYRKGPLDFRVLESCIAEIVRRHETWRTTFDVEDGQPVQVIHPAPRSFSLPILDLRALPVCEREVEAARRAGEDVVRPFDLKQGPLFRLVLIRLDEDDYRLYLAIHQIIVDGVSAYQVLLPELVSLYEAFSKGQSSPLPDLPTQYVDFACWQRNWLTGEVLAAQLAYWRAQLDGAPTLAWGSQRARPARQTFRGRIQPFALPQQLSKQAREFSRRQGVTLFATLLANFYALLHNDTNQSDIVVGTVSPSGRSWSELAPLMGYFLNPVSLRVDLSGNPTIRDLLLRVQRSSAGALSHDDVPFEYLVATLKPEIDSSRNPFFQVAASLEPAMPAIDASWNLTPMDLESGGGRWDLYLVWDDRPGGIIGRAQYNPDILAPADVDQLIRQQELLLRRMLSDPTKRLSELVVEAQSLFSSTVCHLDR